MHSLKHEDKDSANAYIAVYTFLHFAHAYRSLPNASGAPA
jgi:hypothetical protein